MENKLLGAFKKFSNNIKKFGTNVKKIFSRKNKIPLTIESAQRKTKVKKVTSEEVDILVSKLISNIEKSGYNPTHVLNDINVLSSFLRDIVVNDPSLTDVADAYLVGAINKQAEGVARDEALILKLVEEFKRNPNRIITNEGLPYDTSIARDLTASTYIEALFRAFKDKAFDRGLSAHQFRRALDDILTNEPYELYEGNLNNRGNITRSRKLKPVNEIVDLAISRGLGYDGYEILKGW